MKKLMIAAALMAATVSANAQQPAGTFSLQPKVGMTISSITIDNSKYKVGLIAGVEGMYQVSEKFGISAGLSYAMQGCGVDVKDVDDKYKTEYLNIPILANYYVAPGFAIKAGVQPAFLLKSKVGDLDLKDYTESFDCSIPVGVSYEFSDFVIDGRYNIGVTDVFKGDHSANGKNSVFQITVGYKFAL